MSDQQTGNQAVSHRGKSNLVEHAAHHIHSVAVYDPKHYGEHVGDFSSFRLQAIYR